MRRSHITRLLLLVLMAAFAVGWRSPSASIPTGLYNPINMTLADHTLDTVMEKIAVLTKRTPRERARSR